MIIFYQRLAIRFAMQPGGFAYFESFPTWENHAGRRPSGASLEVQ